MPGITGWIPLGVGPSSAAALHDRRDSWLHEPGDSWTSVPGSPGNVVVSAHAGRPGETFIQAAGDDPVVLAFSGELYRGSPAEIVHSYVREGESALERLDGSFVLYLADGRSQSTILATDYLGSRPMYYSQGSGGIFFGPELGMFSGLPGGGSLIDQEHDYFDFLVVGRY